MIAFKNGTEKRRSALEKAVIRDSELVPDLVSGFMHLLAHGEQIVGRALCEAEAL